MSKKRAVLLGHPYIVVVVCLFVVVFLFNLLDPNNDCVNYACQAYRLRLCKMSISRKEGTWRKLDILHFAAHLNCLGPVVRN